MSLYIDNLYLDSCDTQYYFQDACVWYGCVVHELI